MAHEEFVNFGNQTLDEESEFTRDTSEELENSCKTIINIGRAKSTQELINFVKDIPVEKLIDICKVQVGLTGLPTITDYVLTGLDLQFDKKFHVILHILKEMTKKELNYRQVFDVSNHINAELPYLEISHKAELVDFCVDSIRIGDEKFVCWKEILPELLEVIIGDEGSRLIEINKVEMTANSYISKIVDRIFLMKWHKSIFPVIIEMFSECRILNRDDRIKIVKKACEYVQDINPVELPPIAYQLYKLCTTAHTILLAMLSMQRFFNQHRYSKSDGYRNSENDLNFIEAYTEKEVRESEQMVLSHLMDWAENSGDEKEIVEAFKFLSNCPEYIMTPFMFGALLAMSCINRYPDTARMLESPIINYLCKIIKSMETEKTMANTSRYCSDRVQVGTMYSVNDVLKTLVGNSKFGMEYITHGLVNLSFYLLKNEKQLQMQSFAITFLQTFIKQRPNFGSSIIKKLMQYMRSNQRCYQYAECLTSLSLICPATLLEPDCKKEIQNMIDMFELIDGAVSIRMMSFILPLFKQSHSLRDQMMTVMSRVCVRGQLDALQMCVFGYCAILKQLNHKNAHRFIGTLTTASQCSFLGSQSIIADITQRTQSTQRGPEGRSSEMTSDQRFNTMVIDVLTVLKKCLKQDARIKDLLYENLLKAGDTNAKIIPHITFFIEPHFYRYFHLTDDEKLEIKFDSIVREEERISVENRANTQAERDDDEENVDKDTDARLMPPPTLPFASMSSQKVNKELVLMEDLGSLLQFVTQMFVRYNEISTNQNLDPFMTTFDRKQPTFSALSTMKEIFDHLVKEVALIDPEDLGLTGGMDEKKSIVACQFLNVLAGTMAYCAWACTPQNGYIQEMCNIRDQYLKSLDNFKKMNTKKARQGQTQGSFHGTIQKSQFNESGAEFKPKLMWDYWSLQRLLLLVFDDQNEKDTSDWSTEDELLRIRSNKEFKRILLKAVSEKIISLLVLPEYYQVKHSKRQFENICTTTKIVYESCLVRLYSLYVDVSKQVAQAVVEILKNSLNVIEKFYSKKYEAYYRVIAPNATLDDETCKVLLTLQKAVDDFMAVWNGKDSSIEKILVQLFKCIEHVHRSLDIDKDSEFSQASFEWIFGFCKKHNVSKNLVFVNKILYDLHLRYRSENFFRTVAANISLHDEHFRKKDEPLLFTMKTISKANLDVCFNQIVEIIEKEIDDVEYFLKKCRSIYDKVMLIPSDKCKKENDQIKLYERTICSELSHLSYTLTEVANIIPSNDTYARVHKMLYRHYVNMANFLKHLLARRTSLKMGHLDLKSFSNASKPLAQKLQCIIMYIEDNLVPKTKTKEKRGKKKRQGDPDEECEDENEEEEEVEEERDNDEDNQESDAESLNEDESLNDDKTTEQRKKSKKSDKNSAKNKTKNLPNVIQRMEAFHKLMVELGLVVQEPLGNFKTTLGTMREFEIGKLRLAAQQHVPMEEETDSERTNCSQLSSVQNTPNTISDVSQETIINDQEMNEFDPRKALDNLAKLNKKVTKDKPPILNKKITKRKPKVPKINKRILKSMEDSDGPVLRRSKSSTSSEESTNGNNATRFKTTLN